MCEPLVRAVRMLCDPYTDLFPDPQAVLDMLIPIYLNPTSRHSRLGVTTLLFALTVEEEYDPSSPPNITVMYRMAEHAILSHLLQSLTFDTGNNLFALSLKLLLAIIPFAPILFTPHVPMLMVITGRAVCWKERKFVDEGQGEEMVGVTRTYPPAASASASPAASPSTKQGEHETSADSKSPAQWTVAKSTDEPPTNPTALTKASHITQYWLVGMYGAWPSNVLAFIRDPVSYLAGKNISSPYTATWETIYPDAFLAKRAGPLLKDFSLHPMLIYFSSAAELQDTKRWEKNDPSEWLARAQTIAHMERTAGGMYKLLEGYGEAQQNAEEAANLILGIGSGAATPSAMVGVLGDVDGHEGMRGEGKVDEVEQLRRENEDLRLEAMMTDRVRKQYLYRQSGFSSFSTRASIADDQTSPGYTAIQSASLPKSQK